MSDSNHIGWAVYRLEQGYKVKRREWPPGAWLEMAPTIRPQWLSAPLIIFFSLRVSIPYTCPQGDLLAKDWVLA